MGSQFFSLDLSSSWLVMQILKKTKYNANVWKVSRHLASRSELRTVGKNNSEVVSYNPPEAEDDDFAEFSSDSDKKWRETGFLKVLVKN